MQIEIYNPADGQALPPVKWNYDELKQQLTEGLAAYKGRVYTDDTITQAKKDRAALNKLATAIDDKRKDMKARYLQPYQDFEAQAKELAQMVKTQAAEIDAQVKAYEQHRKDEKLAKIKELYTAIIGKLANLVPYERLHESRWLNVTTSMTTITEEMGVKIEQAAAGLKAIDELGLEDDLAEQVKGVFLRDFDFVAAIAEKNRIIKRREELARYAAQTAQDVAEVVQDKPTTERPHERTQSDSAQSVANDGELIQLDFRVWATAAQLAGLKAYLKTNNIKYGRVPAEKE
ncbi:MAG: DUF1351 domain-containing protein [Butyricicoccus pullicaecorum]|nr:DUF1351 domain-containing protein [Butyricicoccus pullicaecorum]